MFQTRWAKKKGGIPLSSSPQTRNDTLRAFPEHTLTTIYEVSEPTEIISIVGIRLSPSQDHLPCTKRVINKLEQY